MGQPLLVLEAGKMGQTVSAPAELRAKVGEQVSTGRVLADIRTYPAKVVDGTVYIQVG